MIPCFIVDINLTVDTVSIYNAQERHTAREKDKSKVLEELREKAKRLEELQAKFM